ncbi:MAG: MSCRAMM family protein, partial [Gemmatimonadaceae bacterium]
YMYTSGPYLAGAVAQSSGADSGHVHYQRLKSGTWIVASWLIRVPVTKTVLSWVPADAGDLGNGAMMHRSTTQSVARVWEIGGDVKEVFDPGNGATGQVSPLGRVQGTLITEGTNSTLSNVAISLTSRTDTTAISRVRTSLDGQFLFDSIEPGNYILRAYTPRLDTLNTPVLPLSLTVGERTALVVTVTVPLPQKGIEALCPGGIRPGLVGLHGSVLDTVTGRPIQGARVRAYWLSGTVYNDAGMSTTPHERITQTDANGRYAFCDLEPTPRLLLSAVRDGRRTPPAPAVVISPGEFRMYDMFVNWSEKFGPANSSR